jgi:hypothetical protein
VKYYIGVAVAQVAHIFVTAVATKEALAVVAVELLTIIQEHHYQEPADLVAAKHLIEAETQHKTVHTALAAALVAQTLVAEVVAEVVAET